MTHILTLTILRQKVGSNQAIKILRVILMGILVVLLVCVMAPVGYLTAEIPEFTANYTGIPLGFPAWGLYHPSLEWLDETDNPILHTVAGYNIIYSVLTMGVIIYGYFSRVLLLFPAFLTRSLLRIPAGQPWALIEVGLVQLQSLRVTASNWLLRLFAFTGHGVLLPIYVLSVSDKRIYGSKIWEVCNHLLPIFNDR
jgi:hypothetical protein